MVCVHMWNRCYLFKKSPGSLAEKIHDGTPECLVDLFSDNFLQRLIHSIAKVSGS